MKRARAPDKELGADDGKSELRAKVTAINNSSLSHEEKGAALRALMTGKRENDKLKAAASSGSTKGLLPENKIVAPMLEAMPVELIETIAQYLLVRDFAALRLAGRAARDKSAHGFVKRFFARRTMRLEWVSMRRVVLILGHAEFGPAVRELCVLVERSGEFLFLQPQATTNTPPTVARRRRIGLPSTHDASKERTIEMMLDRVFGRISVLRSLTLDLVPDSSTFLLSRSAVKMVLAAIATNSTKIESFHIGSERSYLAEPTKVGHRLLDNLDIHSIGLKRCFQNTTSLSLSFAPYHDHHDNDFTAAERRLQILQEFPNTLLELMPNLETLALNLKDEPTLLNHYLVSLPKVRSVIIDYSDYWPPGAEIATPGLLKQFQRHCVPNVEEITASANLLRTGSIIKAVQSALGENVRMVIGMSAYEGEGDGVDEVDDD